MGFPRDATNVYRARSVDLPVKEEPDEFGPFFHHKTIAPVALRGSRSPDSWEWWCEGYGMEVYRQGPVEFADAQVELPTGANVAAVRWWARDEDLGNISIFLFEVCRAGAEGPPSIILRGSADPATLGQDGNQSGVVPGSSGYTVNNRDCYYLARVFFEDPSSDLALQKIRYQWKRDVSPAPAVATFGDVPTSHPFFQFVEALAASGITAGCGGGNYCPDDGLTRGQMAVFLSKALGLYFP